jgi:hypothetical protein
VVPVTPIQANAETGRRFSRLIFAAMESPATVDRNRLLEAADAFLNAAVGGNPAGLYLSRLMANAAADWCVFGGPDDYARLSRAVQCFQLYSQLEGR